MDELQKDPQDEAGGQDSPRLQAILDLLKFLSHSEANRAQPKPDAQSIAAPQDDQNGDIGPDDLEALKSFAGR